MYPAACSYALSTRYFADSIFQLETPRFRCRRSCASGPKPTCICSQIVWPATCATGFSLQCSNLSTGISRHQTARYGTHHRSSLPSTERLLRRITDLSKISVRSLSAVCGCQVELLRARARGLEPSLSKPSASVSSNVPQSAQPIDTHSAVCGELWTCANHGIRQDISAAISPCTATIPQHWPHGDLRFIA